MNTQDYTSNVELILVETNSNEHFFRNLRLKAI